LTKPGIIDIKNSKEFDERRRRNMCYEPIKATQMGNLDLLEDGSILIAGVLFPPEKEITDLYFGNTKINKQPGLGGRFTFEEGDFSASYRFLDGRWCLKMPEKENFLGK